MNRERFREGVVSGSFEKLPRGDFFLISRNEQAEINSSRQRAKLWRHFLRHRRDDKSKVIMIIIIVACWYEWKMWSRWSFGKFKVVNSEVSVCPLWNHHTS